MGETYAKVRLITDGNSIEKRLLVDTGATYSWIRGIDLKKLGVKPRQRRTFETIEGKLVRKRIGFVELECMGERAPTAVVFGSKKDSEVLGLHALEGLALEVDPVNQKLRKSRAIKAL